MAQFVYYILRQSTVAQQCTGCAKEKKVMRIRIPENLTRQAYRSIRDEILLGKLNSGRRLTEDYFAERFEISKSPVREALNRLEAEGLVKIVPRRGAFVVDFSVQDVKEIYELRELLENAVVRGLKIKPKITSELRKILGRAKECIRKNDKLNYISADAAFHTILSKASENSRLSAILESMHNQLLILRHRTFELSGRTSVVEHGQILDALIQGKQRLAARLMVEHIRNVRNRLVKSLSRPHEGEAGGQVLSIPSRIRNRPKTRAFGIRSLSAAESPSHRQSKI